MKASPNTKYVLLLLLRLGSAIQYANFDSASASSVYSAASDFAFAASMATASGSGYWCSSGSHRAEQVVSWTGLLATRQTLLGISLSWAYSPREFKVLTSPDGANFIESACWRPGAGQEVSYVEHVMFEKPIGVRAVAVVMRGPRAWGYFGLNSASVIVESGPAMLVSGATSTSGELCVVTSAEKLSLNLCVDAIAAGTGNEIFRLSDDGLLMSTVKPDACVTLLDGDASDGGILAVSSCRRASEAEDGRAGFRRSAAGQLQLSLGNLCVVARNSGAIAVADCGEAAQANDAGDKFFMVAIPEFDPAFAAGARASAETARKSAVRLAGLIAQLNSSMPAMESCVLGRHRPCAGPSCVDASYAAGVARSAEYAGILALREDDSALGRAIASMGRQLQLDNLGKAIADAKAVIKAARQKL
jgi:hypothetical protein